MPKRKSVREINQRRKVIEEIYDDLVKNGKKPSAKNIMLELTKRGVLISRSTLYTDLTENNKGNTFLNDLVRYNYSAYLHEIWDNIEFVISESFEMYDKLDKMNSDNSKSKSEDTPNDIKITHPKHLCLNTVLKATELKIKMLEGRPGDASLTLLLHQFKMTEQQVAILERKLAELTKN